MLIAAAITLMLAVGGTAHVLKAAVGSTDPEHATATSADIGPLRLGIVPQQSASRLAKIWAPLAKTIGERIGRDVMFVTTKNIPTFEACLEKRAFDIAYMNPYHYVFFSERTGYRALAHQADKRLRGVMVVRKDSAVDSIDDLEDARIAFPSPGAFGASVIPRAEMLARGLVFDPVYVRSHDSVYRAVAAGLVDAGGGVTRTFNSTRADIREQLRIVYRTEMYTPHAIATAPAVPDETRDAIRSVFLDLRENDPHLLEALGMTGFVAASDEDWNDVRALDIRPEQAGMESIDENACPFD